MMLDVDFSEDGIQIKQEGRFEKLVDHVQQISYNGKLAFARGQTMYFVTERAIFRLTENGPMLVEIAKGADLQKDILDHMGFCPLIAENLKTIPTEIYREGAFGLKNIVEGEESL